MPWKYHKDSWFPELECLHWLAAFPGRRAIYSHLLPWNSRSPYMPGHGQVSYWDADGRRYEPQLIFLFSFLADYGILLISFADDPLWPWRREGSGGKHTGIRIRRQKSVRQCRCGRLVKISQTQSKTCGWLWRRSGIRVRNGRTGKRFQGLRPAGH